MNKITSYLFVIILLFVIGCSSLITDEKSSFETESFWMSHAQGFYEADFKLALKSKIGGEIYYTLNGQTPHPDSSGTFHLLKKKLATKNLKRNSNYKIQSSLKEIQNGGWRENMEMPVNGLSINAAIFKKGKMVDLVNLNYIFGEDIGQDINTMMINVDSSAFFGQDSGIYVVGNNPDKPHYLNKGKEWQRQCTINYFNKKGTLVHNSKCGIAVHGFLSRNWAQKSIKLIAKKKFGAKDFNYDFFDNGIKNEKKILLRSSFSGWRNGIYNEALNFSICENLNLEASKEKPVVVFINGEYWGLYFLSEKIDQNYIKKTFNVPKDKINIVADNGYANHGSPDDYRSLIEFVKQNDLKIDSNYKHFKAEFNVKNYIDWYCAQLFIQNQDWPCNNTEIWKKTGDDNKLRHILVDLDASFYKADMDPFKRIYNYTDAFRDSSFNRCNLFFRRLFRNEEFLLKFEKRFNELLETEFSAEKITDKYEKLSYLHDLEYAIPFTLKRWFNSKESGAYQRVEKDRGIWVKERPKTAKKQLDEFIKFAYQESKKPFEKFPAKTK